MPNGTFDKLKASIADLRGETADLLRIAALHQQSLVEHRESIRKPEKRIDRTEVTVEAVLEDLRRHRENRPRA